jgi:putative transcriptional regulator
MITIRLQEIAESRGLNMSQVQRRADLTMGLVRRYWRNETTSIDLRALDKLCDVLGCTPGDLLDRRIAAFAHGD